MTDRAKNSIERIGGVLGIVVAVLTIVGAVFGYAVDDRITTNKHGIEGVGTELRAHKDNSAIHRTAEEARVYERGEQAKWELLMDRLQSIDKRLEKLEAKP
jgi:hypothetical protein